MAGPPRSVLLIYAPEDKAHAEAFSILVDGIVSVRASDGARVGPADLVVALVSTNLLFSVYLKLLQEPDRPPYVAIGLNKAAVEAVAEPPLGIRVAGVAEGPPGPEFVRIVASLFPDSRDLIMERGKAFSTPAPSPPQMSSRRVSNYRFSNEARRIIVAAERDAQLLMTERVLLATATHGRIEPNKTSAVFKDIELREKYFIPDRAERTSEMHVSVRADKLLSLARDAALNTTGTDVISVRHLVGALLQPVEGSYKDRHLKDPLAIREAFLKMIDDNVPEESSRWRRVFAAAAEWSDVVFAPIYDSDSIGDDDFLGFRRDARCLAALVASVDIEPPLSIGLFGDWGAGKTFLMSRMREEVETLAAVSRLTGGSAFRKNIVQIEFNAWNYIEGNLWASLVAHIFSNLRLDRNEDPAASEKRRDAVLRDLQIEEEQKAKAQAEKEAAEGRQRDAESSRDQLVEERTRLNLLETHDWRTTLAENRELLAKFGITEETVESLTKLHEVANEYSGILGTLRGAWKRVRTKGKLLTLLVALAIPGLPLLAYFLLKGWTNEIKAVLTSIAAFAGALSAFVLPYRKSVKEVVDVIDRKTSEIEEKRAPIESRIDDQIAALEKEAAAAARKVEDADDRIQALKKKLEASTPTRMFADYIEERADSKDYRRHLGILANVRRDFDRLAELFKQQQRIAAIDGQEGVDRIILYIDDLDRCPPKLVTDVLQAIHLLLAFPLFVVVVGVDARWIARSLRVRYDKLLDSEGDGHDELGAGASPLDYLEKIFQIPFWVRPMSNTDCENLLEGLARPKRRLAEEETVSGNEAKPPVEAPIPVVLEEGPVAESATGATETVIAAKPDLNPVALQLSDDEVEFLKTLTPLLGRSPRAVKRFVNCYRLIKTSVDPAKLGAFLNDDTAPLHYRPVAFLLATITGMPAFGERLLNAIEKLEQNQTLSDLRETVGDEFDLLGEHDEWSAEALIEAALVVRRYSFRSGYSAGRERTK